MNEHNNPAPSVPGETAAAPLLAEQYWLFDFFGSMLAGFFR